MNAAVHDQAAKEKVKFFGDSQFIPIFFVVTGFLIDPREFYRSIMDNLALAAAVILALITGSGSRHNSPGGHSATLRSPG